jgi:hypothetical protein
VYAVVKEKNPEDIFTTESQKAKRFFAGEAVRKEEILLSFSSVFSESQW